MGEKYKWHYNNVAPWNDILAWCTDNLYHGGHYEPNWHTDGYCTTIYFSDAKEYAWFLMRWS